MRDNVCAGFALSLANMMLRIGFDHEPFGDVGFARGNGSILPAVRQSIAEGAIEKRRATHLLWIDSDHEFPSDTAHRLLAHGRPLVGINATTRTPPIQGTAIRKGNERLVTDSRSKGLERVSRMGFGIALIEARVFLAMEKPWFAIDYVECKDGHTFSGEDVYFCEKAKAAGFAPMIDHDLTKETKHIGAIGWASEAVEAADWQLGQGGSE